MKCAFGKVIITPPGGAAGVPMAGYSRPHYAHGTLDDVCARGVLIEDVVLGTVKRRFLLLSLDVLKVPMVLADYIKDKIKEDADFGLGPGHILVHGIHTHSAPDLTGEFFWPGGVPQTIKGIMFGANRMDRYVVWMVRQIVKMVKEMKTKLQLCKCAWGKELINADVLINRRHPMRKSKKNLNVITFKSTENDKMIGIVVAFGMHPTTLSNMNDKMSADFPGRVCYKIEELSQNKVDVVYFTSAAGDLNPITTCGTDFEKLENDPVARQTVYGQKGDYEHTKKLGYFLGEAAFKLANLLPEKDYYDTLQFKSYVKKFWIPFKDYQPYIYSVGNWLSNKLVMFVKKWLLFPIAMAHPEKQEPNFPGLAVKAAPFSFRRGYNINVYTVVQYSRLTFSKSKSPKETHDLTIMGVPGELFEDIEKKLLRNSPSGPDNTLIIQNANDWCAYLYPLKEYLTQAGYEPFASTTPLAGPAVEKELLLLMNEIKEGVQLGYW